MKKTSYNCDKCGAEKGESNHWICYTRPGFNAVRFFPWTEQEKHLEIPVGHLCGASCSHKLLDEVLGEDHANPTG